MLMRTDPFRDIDRLFDQIVGTVSRPAAMPVDAWRDRDHFYVQLDLPGIEPDSIDCTVQRNVLTVRAERRRPQADGVELVAAERPMGLFSRQMFLGDTLDTDRLEASYEAGVLTLRIPVAEQAKPRKVAVQVGTGSDRRQLTG